MDRLDQADSKSMPSAFGVPSFFADIFFVEPAGHGCIRLYACARQGGEIVPQYVVVIPAECLFEGSKHVREAALAMIDGGGGTSH
jgi:hypothetical protein